MIQGKMRFMFRREQVDVILNKEGRTDSSFIAYGSVKLQGKENLYCTSGMSAEGFYVWSKTELYSSFS